MNLENISLASLKRESGKNKVLDIKGTWNVRRMISPNVFPGLNDFCIKLNELDDNDVLYQRVFIDKEDKSAAFLVWLDKNDEIVGSVLTLGKEWAHKRKVKLGQINE